MVLNLWRSYWQGCCWTSHTEGHFDIPKLAVEEIQEKHNFCRASLSIVQEIHSLIKKSHSSPEATASRQPLDGAWPFEAPESPLFSASEILMEGTGKLSR